jgi:hypothetical protein
VATIPLQMKINRIADSELKALCDAMTPDDGPTERSPAAVSPQGQRQRSAAVLKLVK